MLSSVFCFDSFLEVVEFGLNLVGIWAALNSCDVAALSHSSMYYKGCV